MKILYSKFSRNRLPCFQIKTSILKDQGIIYVEKQALNKEAYAHIQNIYNNYTLLHSKYQNVEFVRTTKLGEDKLRFEFIEGNTLDGLLLSSIRSHDMNRFFKYLREYIDLLKSFGTNVIPKFQADNEFLKVFKFQPELENVECFSETNVDLTFDNILVNKSNSNKVIIDFEWILIANTPMDYIIFRSVSRLFWKYGNYLRGFLKIEEVFSELKISNIEQYQKMERGFQTYVLGNREYEIGSQYRRQTINLSELKNQANEYLVSIERNEASLSDTLMKNEELKREIDFVKQQQNEINSKLIHAQFQSEEFRNKVKNLEEVNSNLISSIHQAKNEIDILSNSLLTADVHISSILEEIRRIEGTWRGTVVKKIIGIEYFGKSQELEKSNEVRIEEYQSKLVLKKNEEIMDLQSRLQEMELKLEQVGKSKLSDQLEINHLKTHLTEILDRYHNVDLQNKHLARQNHENTVKNKELVDVYESIQKEFHQLKHQNENLLNQIYKGLGEEGNH
ncbi:hypothetical protein [Paenibacillus sp. S150]|uniref:hypothetical protein n=1 Tax=Paenibacillus sp. S150 TaxID=2749826 RepID=UPI001C55CD47|nr:hypothetical protein [Paenibacillus sp. S150]MBW4081591.1 hypothetical protein [Paenibacillus sp. S150]